MYQSGCAFLCWQPGKSKEIYPSPERHTFIKGDICDRPLVDDLFHSYKIDTVVHFAAETHVDRSILYPEQFLHTNVVGTFTLLEAARQYWLVRKGPTR